MFHSNRPYILLLKLVLWGGDVQKDLAHKLHVIYVHGWTIFPESTDPKRHKEDASQPSKTEFVKCRSSLVSCERLSLS